jgi:hypothetical protein
MRNLVDIDSRFCDVDLYGNILIKSKKYKKLKHNKLKSKQLKNNNDKVDIINSIHKGNFAP